MRNLPKSLLWGAAFGIAVIFAAGLPAYSQISESDGGLYKLRIVVPEAKLRLKPEGGSLIITKLPLGAYFETKDRVGKYFKITLPSDKEGLVFIGYVVSDEVEIEYVPLGARGRLGQERAISTRPEIPAAPSRIAPARAPAVPESTMAYTDWRLKLDRAKNLRNGGFAFLGGGVVSFIIAAILGEDASRGAKTATIVNGVLWSMAGCGMVIAGSQLASDLEAQGRRQGYSSSNNGFSAGIGAGGGLRISYGFSF